MVEAYSGDTDTLNYLNVDNEEREAREARGLQTLKEKHSAFPWLIQTLDCYERLTDREARFVKVLDKAMPAVTHHLSDGLVFEQGERNHRTPAEWEEEARRRNEWLRGQEWATDQELALSIRELLGERLLDRHREKYPNS